MIVQTLRNGCNNGPLDLMMVGYPKYKYHRLVPRNQPKIEWRM